VIDGVTVTYRVDQDEKRIQLQASEVDTRQFRAIFPALVRELGKPGRTLIANYAGGSWEVIHYCSSAKAKEYVENGCG